MNLGGVSDAILFREKSLYCNSEKTPEEAFSLFIKELELVKRFDMEVLLLTNHGRQRDVMFMSLLIEKHFPMAIDEKNPRHKDSRQMIKLAARRRREG